MGAIRSCLRSFRGEKAAIFHQVSGFKVSIERGLFSPFLL